MREFSLSCCLTIYWLGSNFVSLDFTEFSRVILFTLFHQMTIFWTNHGLKCSLFCTCWRRTFVSLSRTSITWLWDPVTYQSLLSYYTLYVSSSLGHGSILMLWETGAISSPSNLCCTATQSLSRLTPPKSCLDRPHLRCHS